MLLTRRSALRLALSIAAAGAASKAGAQPAGVVPPDVQAKLIARVAGYDRNFAARAIDRANVLLVARAADPESARFVEELRRAFASTATIGGLPHEEETTEYADAAGIAATCTSHRISIVYFGPGLLGELAALRAVLTPLDVLSVGAVPEYVAHGIVLAFDASAGRPRCVVNLPQARAQNVKFAARLLKLATLYE